MTAPLYTVSFIESGWPQQFVILFSDTTCDSYDGVGLWNRSLDTWGEEEEQKERLTLFAEPCILGAPQAQMVALFCWGVLYRLAPQVGQVVKNPPVNSGDIRDMGSIPGLGRSLEVGMATHSSIFGWKIPWTEEPGMLQFTGSQKVRHDWSDLACVHIDHLHFPHRQTCISVMVELWIIILYA